MYAQASRASLSSLFFVLFMCIVEGKPPLDVGEVPGRIIRTCCSFGSDLRMMGVPIARFTQITSVDRIGPHQYLGGNEEENGIVYTRRGGFIDLGHLRDQADWTSFIYGQLTNSRDVDSLQIVLGNEGGLKTLFLRDLENASEDAKIKLAGAVAYDLSAWHEIATWFGSSMIPFVPERYSSFSIEDAYSNLLGVTIGMKAIQSNYPYEEAMTMLIKTTLEELDVVATEKETYDAMEMVEKLWWTRDYKLPTWRVLVEREMHLYPELSPWLIPEISDVPETAHKLKVPMKDESGTPLNSYYELQIKLNRKFPLKKIFTERKDRTISQKDYPYLIDRVKSELAKKISRNT